MCTKTGKASLCVVCFSVAPHLVPVLAEVVHGAVGVHSIDRVSLSFVFVKGLQHILDPPKFPLNVDMLRAGRLRLSCEQKKKMHAC